MFLLKKLIIKITNKMIDIKDVVDGKLNGKQLWVCDLRYKDYSKKPIRNIHPTFVLVCNNSETNQRVNYSYSHFVRIHEDGKTMKGKGIIKPFDNTGYRAYTGIPIKCFETKNECIKYFKNQVSESIQGLRDYLKQFSNDVNDKISSLEKLLIK